MVQSVDIESQKNAKSVKTTKDSDKSSYSWNNTLKSVLRGKYLVMCILAVMLLLLIIVLLAVYFTTTEDSPPHSSVAEEISSATEPNFTEWQQEGSGSEEPNQEAKGGRVLPIS
ncbi:uncharacterized protein [Periplaneta americana]|uniref:uncharacterized protein n=1 Tax=Periplaneta americana TaxID=6978 RepID=UPI0037E81DE6